MPEPMHRNSDTGPGYSAYGPEGHGYFEPRWTTPRCVECGRFTNCEDPDASCDYTPDSDRSSERIEWTCGPCVRRHPAQGEAPDALL